MQTAGVILDIYDDTKGQILREKLAGREFPKSLAESSLLPQEKLASLPDRLFALVAVDGDQTLRKYAMHDAQHLTTSILYFLECGHLLPEPAQKVAAVNMVNACPWYGFDPPQPLVKKAFLGKALGALGVLGTAATLPSAMKEGAAKNKAQMDQYRQIQATGQLPAEGAHIKHSALFDDMLRATEAAPPPGLKKRSDLTGTEMMPASGSIATAPSKRTNTAKTRSNHVESKCASEDVWFGPVDITGLAAPVKVKEASYTKFCLEGKYPIDSYEQVKQAEAYFDEHWKAFMLPERRSFAFNLVNRANELGVKVAGRALDYAGTRYGRHIQAELHKRASTFEGHKAGSVYRELQTKIASIDPDTAVQTLYWADNACGASRAYGKPVVGFRDPYEAVFGVKTAKEQVTGKDDASENADSEEKDEFVWNQGTDFVTGDQLRYMANRNEELDGVLGEGFSREFNKDPVGVFKSLPDPQKHVLARLASDNSGGTFRQ